MITISVVVTKKVILLIKHVLRATMNIQQNYNVQKPRHHSLTTYTIDIMLSTV